ncbi:UNKNOWN [Stylonychia lemnae]|uniref:Uncharacterized protein n=1 Tax=Stylonychia lemnae TaxID=5949 RepID=A0A077ZV20_STYLE|nr:UNKNOWN [Stylonychia lemnae]|eukprot:CDW73145.1 UNKNOWN [Stylonychia lemnae]
MMILEFHDRADRYRAELEAKKPLPIKPKDSREKLFIQDLLSKKHTIRMNQSQSTSINKINKNPSTHLQPPPSPKKFDSRNNKGQAQTQKNSPERKKESIIIPVTGNLRNMNRQITKSSIGLTSRKSVSFNRKNIIPEFRSSSNLRKHLQQESKRLSGAIADESNEDSMSYLDSVLNREDEKKLSGMNSNRTSDNMLPIIDEKLREQIKKHNNSKSLLDGAIQHFNSNDQRIVSYVELLKKKQDQEKMQLLQRRITRKMTMAKQSTFQSKFRNRSAYNLSQIDDKISRLKLDDDEDSDLERDTGYSQNTKLTRRPPVQLDSLQRKLKDLAMMKSFKDKKKTLIETRKNSQEQSPDNASFAAASEKQLEAQASQGGNVLLEDEFDRRNQDLYDMLKQYKVCVIPDHKIITLDKLPAFSIIEGNIKQVFKSKEQTKISKQNYQNLNSLQNSTLFYQQLNKEASQHLNKNKSEDFYSASLNSKKFNRVTGVGACTRIDTHEILEKKVKEMYQQAILDQKEDEVIDQLLGPILEQEIPNFNQLPPMKRLVLALKTKVGQEELKNQLFNYTSNMNNGTYRPKPKKTIRQVFEQYHKISSFKKKLNKVEDENVIRGIERMNRRQRFDDDNFDFDQLPPDLRFFHKFKSIIRKQIRSIVNNTTLENAYKQEKRRLEIEILKNNEKNKVTQVIINQIDPEEAQDPRTQYRFTYYKQRLKQLRRAQQLGKYQKGELEIQKFNSGVTNPNQVHLQLSHDRIAPKDTMSRLLSLNSSAQLSNSVINNKSHHYHRTFLQSQAATPRKHLNEQEGEENNSSVFSSEELLDNVFFDKKDYSTGINLEGATKKTKFKQSMFDPLKRRSTMFNAATSKIGLRLTNNVSKLFNLKLLENLSVQEEDDD